jgi:competence protein ComEC
MLFYLFLLFLFRSLAIRTARSISFPLCCLLLLITYHTISVSLSSPQRGIAFYNVRGCPAVHCLADNSASWLVCADTLPDVTRLERSLSSYWSRLRLERPDVIEGDCLLPEISVRNKTVFYAGKRICLLYDDRWGNKISDVPVSIDYLYVSHGYKGDMQELVSLFEVGTVVIDASLSEYYRERIISDCIRLGIPYLPLSEKGSVHILL